MPNAPRFHNGREYDLVTILGPLEGAWSSGMSTQVSSNRTWAMLERSESDERHESLDELAVALGVAEEADVLRMTGLSCGRWG